MTSDAEAAAIARIRRELPGAAYGYGIGRDGPWARVDGAEVSKFKGPAAQALEAALDLALAQKPKDLFRD